MKQLEKGDIVYAEPNHYSNYANVRPFAITRVTPQYAYGTPYSAEVQMKRTTAGDTFAATGLSGAKYKILTPEIQAQIDSDKKNQDIYLWFSKFAQKATEPQKEQVYNLFNS